MMGGQEVASILRLYEAWKAPWEAGYAAGVARFYTEGAIQMPAGEPDIIGREAFQASLETLFDQFTLRGSSSEILEVEAAGDLAFVRGTFAMILTPRGGGEPVRYSGKFVHILRRQPDGAWKIHRAIGVDDHPPRK